MSNSVKLDVEKTLFYFIESIVSRWQYLYPTGERDKDIVKETDIVYDEAHAEDCKLDLYYLPGRKRTKYPVLVYVHGGGFVAGDKKSREGTCRWLAQQGLFVVAVNYGLCPAYRFPEPLLHLIRSLSWIKENAKAYNLNSRKVIGAGDSAGGYYAMMMALVQCTPKLQTRFGVKPALRLGALALNCGLYDVESILRAKMPFNIPANIFKGFTGLDTVSLPDFEFGDSCAPVDFISAALPPLLLIYSKHDILCPGQTESIIEKLEERHVYYESFYSDKFLSNHCFPFAWFRRDSKLANDVTLDFIRRYVSGTLREPSGETIALNIVEDRHKAAASERPAPDGEAAKKKPVFGKKKAGQKTVRPE
ncbi:MAG: alpha/beta hydrolase [Clostridiales bacterium]|jgi:acetyl esterase/lipase|nr:alpha/beta hydrolase [Clostridiales bacterium]